MKLRQSCPGLADESVCYLRRVYRGALWRVVFGGRNWGNSKRLDQQTAAGIG
jgi:hypothetical protein